MDHVTIARAMFGTTMGFHIIFATIGVGLPLMMLLAELMYQKTNDFHYAVMAKRWTKAFAVLLGVGIPTGTIAGVQLSLLWPGFMEVIGRVMALPFQIEIYAFFIEALFMSIYVYAADRIPPWMRIISLTLVAIGAVASAVLISNVHAFQGTPAGFRVENGRIVDVEPWKAFFNKSFLVTAGHVALSAYTTGAFVVASVAAFKMLKAGAGSMLYGFHKKALMIAVIAGGIFALLTALNGHATTQHVFEDQPEKLAAAEGLFETQTHAPLTVIGWSDKEDREVKWGIEIPWLLSFLAGNSFDTEVTGLNDFPEELWPPLWVHTMFNIMFITGSLLILLAIVTVFWDKWLKKDMFPKFLLWIFVLSGPASVAAIESGWILGCSGRQPWSIYRTLSTANSVTATGNLGLLYTLFIIVYAILGAAVVFVLLYYFKRNTVLDDIHRAEQKGVPLFGSNS
ncbi:cytochrome ubiquinol oxidase subunit I [Peribacillus glennii]|uniref:Cytochrome ubiquinol oxidase subunit I n=1 Tax=Peribacillus glennii TaxID=2303991 RepID=A0A372L7H5_9BACI|nr:cytochrome ubiquinol oxidase subunit I [Peribacillus glennii]RFU60569.1 cytochrome ubiquinol oxidase subunit I [Peribacillus glennii]